MSHLRYLRYVLIHKMWVFVECAHYGLWLNGIVHDWQKFTSTEWGPYVKTFYGPYKYTERPAWLKDQFDRAWLHHQHLGPHHWQHWVLREDDGATRVLEMPIKYRKEMVADWIGAGRALGHYVPGDRLQEVGSWYLRNRDKILLGDLTRMWVEAELKVEDAG